MTRLNLFFAGLALTAIVAVTPAANAAPTVHFIGAGSSAVYQGMGVATVNDIAPTTLGIHHYTLKNNTKTCTGGAVCSYLHDPRLAGIPNETTQLWIVWTCPTTGCTGSNAVDVWAYGQVDSTVGNRTFLARAAGCASPCNVSSTTFVVDPAVEGSGGTVVPGDVISPFLFQYGDTNTTSGHCPTVAPHNNTCDAPSVPADVWQAVSGSLGQPLTGAFTDIRPEDAKYATKRINKPLDSTTWDGLGYCTSGACNLGAQIISGVDGTSAATPVNFGLPGAADPITGTVVPTTITVLPIGESPIVFVTNRSNTKGLGAVTSTGAPYYSNLVSYAPQGGIPTVFGIGKLFKSKDCEGNNAAFGVGGANALPPNGTLMNISLVSVPGKGGAGTADYKYTVVSGPGPQVNDTVSIVFFPNNGNNGTYTITAINPGGTVNKFEVANSTAVAQTASASALTNDFPVHVVIREPLSGTYNTMEFGSARIYGSSQGSLTNSTVPTNSQEGNVIVNNGVGDNPLWGGSPGTGKPCIASYLTGANGTLTTGDKVRSVGSGQEVAQVHAVADSIGYTFFSFGNVSSLATSTSYGYLTVDGVDPLFTNYSGGDTGQPGNGELPFCDATGATTPSCLGFGVWGSKANLFPHLKDGTYRVWSLLRALCDTANAHCLTTSDPLGLQALIAAAQNDIDNGTGVPDFLPFDDITETRAHFQSGANFGAPTGPLPSDTPEAGGDVGGCLIPTVVSAGTVNCHQ
jgi:hypothetical protein